VSSICRLVFAHVCTIRLYDEASLGDLFYFRKPNRNLSRERSLLSLFPIVINRLLEIRFFSQRKLPLLFYAFLMKIKNCSRNYLTSFQKLKLETFEILYLVQAIKQNRKDWEGERERERFPRYEEYIERGITENVLQECQSSRGKLSFDKFQLFPVETLRDLLQIRTHGGILSST